MGHLKGGGGVLETPGISSNLPVTWEEYECFFEATHFQWGGRLGLHKYFL